LKSILLVLFLAISTVAQQQGEPITGSRPRSIAEIDASLSTIQELLNDLNLKKAALERERASIVQVADKKAAIDGALTIVVRVSGERSVVLLVNGREREVYLSGFIVKLGRRDEAVAFLTRGLSNGVTYPRCVDPECFEVELFTDKTQPSVNCALLDSGIAMAATGSTLTCHSAPSVAATETKEEVSPISSPSHVPGTDVHVKGYYRKDGTYVKPHTRSAPGRRKN
jgi:hypothetical protein